MLKIKLDAKLNNDTILQLLNVTQNLYKSGFKTDIVELDFNKLTHITPSAMSTLLTLILDLKERFGIKVREALDNKNAEVIEYMTRMGFYDYVNLDRTYDKRKYPPNDRFTEVYKFNPLDEYSENDVCLKTADIIKVLNSNQKNKQVRNAFHSCIGELISNASDHSLATTCVTHSQKYYNHTQFSIADNGIGIRETMGGDNIKESLIKSIQKGCKGVNSAGQGFGLYSSTAIIEQDTSSAYSYIEIHSEDAIIRVVSGKSPVIIDAPYWQGTRITMNINNSLNCDVFKITESNPNTYDNEDLGDFVDENIFG